MSASVELLKAARAKIADPANWTQGALARLPSGDRTVFADPSAKCWCAIGAIRVVGCSLDDEAMLEEVSNKHFYGLWPHQVNDRLGHDAVLRLYDLAIAKAEASNA